MGESYERLKAFKEDILRRQESAKDKRIRALEAALKQIAEHPHCITGDCADFCNDGEEYSGCVTGHRCCADIARKALGK